MRLKELAEHINRINNFLENEINEHNLQKSKLVEEERSLFNKGVETYNEKRVKVRKELERVLNEIDNIRNVKKSVEALVDIDVQIPTRL